ncbi:MAG: alpha-L-fucosidase [Bacteroidota bacterium]
MKRRTLLKTVVGTVPALAIPGLLTARDFFYPSPAGEKIAAGPFAPTWNSLQNYKVPDWFRDAKFGMWAHWGPQCQPEHGDWYARSMYIEDSDDYKFHLKEYGHPSEFGFKDIINQWKAENFQPEQLIGLYKRAGAKYFMALANHHDNFDTYNSKYQPWNAVKMGPKKDLMAGWAKAAKSQGLRFAVSVHAAHAWMFYEKAQNSDQRDAYKGIPYDGRIKKEAGKNKWWEGFDPQDLYAQNHLPSTGGDQQNIFFTQWDWSHHATVPDKKYCENFFNRTLDLIDSYEPDLVYFDDTVLPLYPVSDAGLRIAAHLYNKSAGKNNGTNEAVITGKILDKTQRQCMVWDIERGQSNEIEPLPWQTDTCLGNWHYDKSVFNNHGYKTARTVVHTLADVVSKNGNLMLNVPVRGDGTIDADEQAIVEAIARWMEDNSESVFGTRPWKIFGEGPAMEASAPLKEQGFNEGQGKPFTGEDIRFTTKGNVLYAIALGQPVANKVIIKSLAAGSKLYPGNVTSVRLCGSNESLDFKRHEKGLEVNLPMGVSDKYAYSLKIESV